MAERILIIDFGSQLTQLIARRVRESGVYSEVHPFNKITKDTILAYQPKGIILSGGPASVTEIGTPKIPNEIFNMNIPILAICYGQQTMVAQLGGTVEVSIEREFGRSMLDIHGDCPLFSGVWAFGEKIWN